MRFGQGGMIFGTRKSKCFYSDGKTVRILVTSFYGDPKLSFISCLDDLGVVSELNDLKHVFTDLFQYGVTIYEIPSEKPDKALKRRIFDFLDHDEIGRAHV